MNDIINELITNIRSQVQDPELLEDISEKLMQKKYRQVFLIFNDLKESGRWKLSEDDEKNLERFWWEYAN